MGKIELTDVTLVALTSVELEATITAMERSCRGVQFGAVKLFSPEKRQSDQIEYEWIEIDRIDLSGYNRFVIERLGQYIKTEYCLIVQADGFVTNHHLWKDSFLDYDYIGAPWSKVVQCVDQSGKPSSHEFKWNRVGNGGFSLRSRRFLEFSSRHTLDGLKRASGGYHLKQEDAFLCDYLYSSAIASGIKYAPMEIAAEFSIEAPLGIAGRNPTQTFGFHGKPWMPYVENYFNLIDFDPGVQG